VGIVLLLAGVLLILWAWGNWVFRASRPESTSRFFDSHAADLKVQSATAVAVLPQILMYAMAIVLVVLFGSYALVRAFRNYREPFSSSRPPSTPVQNIWRMHKVPEYDVNEDSGRNESQ